MPLTLKQHRFVTEYLVLSTGARPHSGGLQPENGSPTGARPLKNVDVQAALATKQTRQLQVVEIRIEDVLRDLTAIVHTDSARAL